MPDPWQACCPILLINRSASLGVFCRGQNSRRRQEFRAGHFSSYGAGSDTYARIVSDAFCFSQVAARHHVQLVASFSKPHRSCHRDAVLAECRQRNVFLAADRRWNRVRHDIHCKRRGDGRSTAQPLLPFLRYRAWFAGCRQIDPALSSVLKALHAQMDARPLAASQKDTRSTIRSAHCSSSPAGIFRRRTCARHGIWS